jgi:very-short-patch-repair endonuclease
MGRIPYNTGIHLPGALMGIRRKRIRKRKKRRYTLEEKEAYAAKLRKRMTPAEQILWRRLRSRKGFNFEAQQVICGYIPDFVERDAMLIIEVDGAIHRYRQRYDSRRTQHLRRKGYKVLRYTNSQVRNDIDLVLEEVLAEARLRLGEALHSRQIVAP